MPRRLARSFYSSLYLQYSHLKRGNDENFLISCEKNFSIFRFKLISWRIKLRYQEHYQQKPISSQSHGLNLPQTWTNCRIKGNQLRSTPIKMSIGKCSRRPWIPQRRRAFRVWTSIVQPVPLKVWLSWELQSLSLSLSFNLFLRFSLIRGRAYLGISFGSKLLTLDTSVVNSAFTRLPGYPLSRLTSCQPFERKRRGHGERDRPALDVSQLAERADRSGR